MIIGLKHIISGNYEEAVKYFDLAIVLNPNDPSIWNDKGKN